MPVKSIQIKQKNTKLVEERRPMDAASEFGTTQRAYTMRLSANSDGGSDAATLDALWATHEAVNEGVKAFGDWLLTLRGGLDHRLGDGEINADKSEPERTRDRRILLALSWLSVESKQGSPAKFLVKHDFDAKAGRRSNWKTCDALKDILTHRGLSPEEIRSCPSSREMA